jgi:rhamnosyltransferase
LKQNALKAVFFTEFMHAFARFWREFITVFVKEMIGKWSKMVNSKEQNLRSKISNTNPYLLQKSLNLTKILPKYGVLNSAQVDNTQKNKTKRVALIIHSYFPDLAEYLLHYAQSMPENADIFITTPSEENAKNLQQIFENAWKNGSLQCNKFEVRVIPNRGRDVAALLVAAKDIVRDYDLFCFAHDKKSSYMLPETVGEAWSDKLFECNLASRDYVHNIIDAFAADEFLGLTFAPVPDHGMYFFLLGGKYNWRENARQTRLLQEKIGTACPLDDKIPLIAPLGSMFWARTKAVEKLFALDWNYDDFPEEPLGLDATISHAIERVWAYTAADSGYYCAYTMPDEYFSAQMGAFLDYAAGFADVLGA